MAPAESPEGAKGTESRKRTAAGALVASASQPAAKTGDGDDTSTASTTVSREGAAPPLGSREGGEESEGEAGCGGHPKSEVFYDDDEVEAASNLATFILAASHVAPAKPKKPQPSSAPAALGMAQAAPQGLGGGGAAEAEDPSVSKKQRRREKNRASAQQSRQRKKCHLDELENRVEHLEGERRALQVRLETLSSQNDVLRRQLDKQRQLLAPVRPGSNSQAANSQDDKG